MSISINPGLGSQALISSLTQAITTVLVVMAAGVLPPHWIPVQTSFLPLVLAQRNFESAPVAKFFGVAG